MGKSILTEKQPKYNDKDGTAIRKHCRQNNHQADSSCFTVIGSAYNNFHLKLKESLLILKLKPSLRDRSLSMSDGRPEGFVGVMKYFRHIFMGHEIFFKIFDGPQNIFSCSVFAILLFKLRGLENIQTNRYSKN